MPIAPSDRIMTVNNLRALDQTKQVVRSIRSRLSKHSTALPRICFSLEMIYAFDKYAFDKYVAEKEKPTQSDDAVDRRIEGQIESLAFCFLDKIWNEGETQMIRTLSNIRFLDFNKLQFVACAKPAEKGCIVTMAAPAIPPMSLDHTMTTQAIKTGTHNPQLLTVIKEFAENNQAETLILGNDSFARESLKQMILGFTALYIASQSPRPR